MNVFPSGQGTFPKNMAAFWGRLPFRLTIAWSRVERYRLIVRLKKLFEIVGINIMAGRIIDANQGPAGLINPHELVGRFLHKKSLVIPSLRLNNDAVCQHNSNPLYSVQSCLCNKVNDEPSAWFIVDFTESYH